MDDLLAAKVTGKKFDHKDKLAQAMPLLKKTRACVRWLRAELERAGEASRATVTRLEVRQRMKGKAWQCRGCLAARGGAGLLVSSPCRARWWCSRLVWRRSRPQLTRRRRTRRRGRRRWTRRGGGWGRRRSGRGRRRKRRTRRGPGR